MQEQLISTQTCSDEQGNIHTFRYYLLTEEVPFGAFHCEHYGVRVDGTKGESAAVRSVTTSRSRLDGLLSLLTRCRVSPSHLDDIVRDWLVSSEAQP